MESILITGGAGFFGRHFTRFLLERNACRRICIFSRSEHSQANLRTEFNDDDRLRFFIGDVRNKTRLRRAMNGIDVVIHAAALKRIEAATYNPTEVALTNVIGTANLIEAAQDAGVKKAILLSTDKAYAPIGAYGASKLLAESMFLASNETGGFSSTRFSVTRYGNIWNATGSVVPRWRDMIAKGATRVPVSDPRCTRFFMRAEEACQLVLDTIEVMVGNEVVIPDLPAYCVSDLIDALGVVPHVTGLPNWEKLHEKMDEDHSSDKARRMTVAELRHELGLLPKVKVAA